MTGAHSTDAALRGWSFERNAAPLLLPDDPALKEALLSCLDGWSFQPVRSQPDEALARPTSCGLWKITTRYSDRPTGALSLASAVCASLREGAVLQDDRYAYVRLPSAQPCGTEPPRAAILSFERREDHPPGLWALPAEEALPLLLRQSLTRFETASQALDHLTALMLRLPRARLICSDPHESDGRSVSRHGP